MAFCSQPAHARACVRRMCAGNHVVSAAADLAPTMLTRAYGGLMCCSAPTWCYRQRQAWLMSVRIGLHPDGTTEHPALHARQATTQTRICVCWLRAMRRPACHVGMPGRRRRTIGTGALQSDGGANQAFAPVCIGARAARCLESTGAVCKHTRAACCIHGDRCHYDLEAQGKQLAKHA